MFGCQSESSFLVSFDNMALTADYIGLTKSFMLPCMTKELDPTKLSLEEMKTMVQYLILIQITMFPCK